ncbi:MAG: hypothetical protein GDA52_06425 [Rhodobacteraceae bacterium]|nr:hypothetical protein [Paracoccaceae bacterium]
MLRDDYIKGTRRAEGEPRMLWFNDGNTSDKPPGTGHVFDLPVKVLGTVIAVRYSLDPDH